MVDDATVLWLRRKSQLEELGTQQEEVCLEWSDDGYPGHILALLPVTVVDGVGFVDAHEGWCAIGDADTLDDGLEDGGYTRLVFIAEECFVGGMFGG